MLTVEFSQVAVTTNSLRVGVVVRYGPEGPVRFAQLVIDDDALDWQALQDLAEYVVRQTNRHLDREREIEDDLTLPSL
jgi:hypothetical protein